jgi:hypothetical protein
MQTPDWQVVEPLTHIAPPPHVQTPDVHPSARVALHDAPPPQVQTPDVHPSASAPHAMHMAAPVPHAVTVGGDVQTLPVQHPEPHEFASHVQT